MLTHKVLEFILGLSKGLSQGLKVVLLGSNA
jgi:hypothetical protein